VVSVFIAYVYESKPVCFVVPHDFFAFFCDSSITPAMSRMCAS